MIQRMVGSETQREMGSNTGLLTQVPQSKIAGCTARTRDDTRICPVPLERRNIIGEFMTELWAFLTERKKIWVLPFLMVGCSLVLLVVFTRGSEVDPALSALASEQVEEELYPPGFFP